MNADHITPDEDRRMRRELAVVAAAGATVGAAGLVVLARVSPEALKAIAGSSQIARALRACAS